MAEARQYAEWLQANQDKKGSDLYNRAMEGYKMARELELKDQKPDAPEEKSRIPVIQAGRESGFMRGLMDPAAGIAQLSEKLFPDRGVLPPELVLSGIKIPSISERVSEEERLYQENRAKTGQDGFDFQRLGGNIVSPVSLAGMRIPMGAATLPARIGKSSMVAGGYGLTQPVTDEEALKNYGSSKVKQGLTSMAVGGGIPVAGSALGWGKNYIDELTRPWGIRNWSKVTLPTGEKIGRGVYKDIQQYADDIVEKSGIPRDKVIQALIKARTLVPGNKPTAGQALAEAQGTERFASPLVRLEADLARSPAGGDVLKNRYLQQKIGRESPIEEIAGTVESRKLAEENLKRLSDEIYPKVSGQKIPYESDKQLREQMVNKISERIADKQKSKGWALKDWGRSKTLAQQQENIATGGIPVSGTLRQQSSRFGENVSPAEPVTGTIPRIKGEVLAPARYTPQRQIAVQAEKAAQEFQDIANKHQMSIDVLTNFKNMLKQATNLDDVGLNNFLNRPAVIDAVKKAKIAAENTGKYFPSKPGDQFTVGNLARIKRELADNINDTVGAAGQKALTNTERQEYTSLLKEFDEFIKSKSHGFAKADEQYAAEASKVSRAKLADAILNKMRSPTGQETPAGIIRAMDDEAKLIKSATGFGRNKGIEDVLPDVAPHIKKSVEEMERDALMKSIAGKTNPVLSGIKGEVEPMFPALINAKAAVSNWLLRKIGKDMTPQYERGLAFVMRDPENARYMMDLANRDVSREVFMRELNKLMVMSGGITSGREMGAQ